MTLIPNGCFPAKRDGLAARPAMFAPYLELPCRRRVSYSRSLGKVYHLAPDLFLYLERRQHFLDVREYLVLKFRQNRANHEIAFVVNHEHPLSPAHLFFQL